MHLFIFFPIVSTVPENVQYHINVPVLWAVEVTRMMIVIAVAHGGLEEVVMGAMLPHFVKKGNDRMLLCVEFFLCS